MACTRSHQCHNHPGRGHADPAPGGATPGCCGTRSAITRFVPLRPAGPPVIRPESRPASLMAGQVGGGPPLARPARACRAGRFV